MLQKSGRLQICRNTKGSRNTNPCMLPQPPMLPQICNLRYNDTQAEKKSGRLQICRNTKGSRNTNPCMLPQPPMLPQICNLRYNDKQTETNPADYKSAGTHWEPISQTISTPRWYPSRRRNWHLSYTICEHPKRTHGHTPSLRSAAGPRPPYRPV